MLKRTEAVNPNSCWTRARDDEMIFVLLGRDIAAAEAVRYWVKLRLQYGKNKIDDPQILEAYHCADEMQKQAESDRAVCYGDPNAKRPQGVIKAK